MGASRIDNFVVFALQGAADRGKLCGDSAPYTHPVGRGGRTPRAIRGLVVWIWCDAMPTSPGGAPIWKRPGTGGNRVRPLSYPSSEFYAKYFSVRRAIIRACWALGLVGTAALFRSGPAA